MAAPSIAELLKFADLQMAAEAFVRDPLTDVLHGTGQDLIVALMAGNGHSSRFTELQAIEFEKNWKVLDQRANTATGFSGTLFQNKDTNEIVMSFRSTEFIDDAARDNQATNTLEIKNTGFAWGQIADMQAWYAELQSSGKLAAGQPFSVTGYSLGGHLATAFNLLNPTAALQTVTFNGAGVGQITQGDLQQSLADFNALRQSPELIQARLGDSTLASHYGVIHSHLDDTSWTAAQAKEYLNGAYAGVPDEYGVPTGLTPEALMLWRALDDIDTLAKEAARVPTLTAGGNGPEANTHPANVPAAKIAALDLDYRMAVRLVDQNTVSVPVPSGLAQAYGSKAMLSVPGGNNALVNQYDVVADTSPSAVSHSQWHYGQDVRIGIEDQPLYRGGIGAGALGASLDYGDIKLLVDGYATRDFGDTHSLVLLVDSLNLQNTLLQMLPEGQRSSAAGTLQQILLAASNLRKVDGALLVGSDQGKAEGDVLENVLNALANLALGPGVFTPLKGSPDGGTWFNMTGPAGYSGRDNFYALLKQIQDSTFCKNAVAGSVTLQLAAASADLASQGHTDFGVFAALHSLSPFVLSEGGAALESAVGQLWGTVYTDWKADRDALASGAVNPSLTFTDRWLQDRAALLVRKNFYNEKNASYDSTDPNAFGTADAANATFDGEDIVWTDRQAQIKIERGGLTANTRYVVFGSDSNEADITGGSRNDSLYGGGGNDVVAASDGADYLEGNAGDDTLEGGHGADVLHGGQGFDTYVLRSTELGSDTIRDSDGSGRISVVGADNTETVLGQLTLKQLDSHTWRSEDSRFMFSTRIESDGSTTLSIQGSGISATVKKFQSGHLGISLPGAPAPEPDPVTSTTIVGDLQPVDPAQTDELGNLVTTSNPQPGRDDTLYDSAGDDHIKSLAGNDSIELTRGGNDWVQAGDGRDFVDGGTGNDTVEGGAGRDVIFGQGGDDLLWANADASLADILAEIIAAADSEADLVGGGQGNDTVIGWAGADALFGGGGRDLMIGGAGDDNILGDRVAGAVDLQNWQLQRQVATDAQGNTTRTLIFNSMAQALGSAPDGDVIMAGAGSDWVVADGGDDYVDGGSDDDYIVGGGGADAILGAEGNDELIGDGDVGDASLLSYADPATHGNDYLDGGAGTDRLTGGGGADELRGGSDNDVLLGDSNALPGEYHGQDYLYGDGGDDELAGGGDADDLYGGDGNDQMDGDSALLTGAWHGRDRLWGGAGDDFMVGGGNADELFGGADNDLIYGDNPSLAAEFHGDDYLDGGDGDDELRGQGGNDNLVGGVGADILAGDEGDDTLEGGVGGDQLFGGAGNDTYVFNAGDASTPGFQEVLQDTQGVNRLALHGMNLDSIDLLPTTAAGMFLLQSGADEIYVDGLMGGSFGAVEVDGASYAVREFFGQTFAWDVIETTDTPNAVLQGGKSSDTLTATGGSSTLAGGRGADVLVGSGGNNTYLFGVGDGTDTIVDSSPPAPNTANELQFGSGISAQSLVLSRDGDQLVIGFGPNSADQLKLGGFDASNAVNTASIDRFEFADSTVLTYAELVGRGFDIVGYGGDEVLEGTNLADRLTGGAGSDTLAGGGGADVYTFNLGDGPDVISDDDAAAGIDDTLHFGSYIGTYNIGAIRIGYDVTFTVGSDQVTLKDYFRGGVNAVERIQFSDGTQWTQADVLAIIPGATDGADTIAGDEGDNTLDGRAGNDVISGLGGNDMIIGGQGDDQLDGGPGDDLYLFTPGDGADQIEDSGGNDTLRFAAGVDPASIAVEDSGNDLKLVLASAGDSVTLRDYLAPSPATTLVERVEFADGTVWLMADVIARRLGGTSGADVIAGFAVADQIDALAGNDIVHGHGGDDVLRGNTGADTLHGGAGNDTYDYRVGDGADVVNDVDPVSGGGGTDTLLLGAGIAASTVALQRQGDDLLVQTGVVGDTVTVAGYFSRGDFERIEFSNDGTVWSQFDIGIRIPINGTAGVDTITGTAASDLIDGGAGSDTIHGGGGDDVILGGTDPSNKITYRDYLYGDDGNDVIMAGTAPASMYSGSGNNLLVGGALNDYLRFDPTTHNIVIGGKENDSCGDFSISWPNPTPVGRNLYLYNSGDGTDNRSSIDFDDPSVLANDVLSLGQTQYSKLGITGGIGYDHLELTIGRTFLILSSYSRDTAAWNVIKYLQIVVAAGDYAPTSSDPLKNKKIVVIDYTAFGQEYYATATSNSSFDLLGTLRKHIVWSSDTEALGGKIAYEYATTGNISTVTSEQRTAILADPNLNLLGQSIAGTSAFGAEPSQAAPEVTIELVGSQMFEQP